MPGGEGVHGDRNQNQRQRALDAFTAGHPRVLVATDVAARGIHVDDVDLVVQFDPPNDHKDYLHRSGRTARAGATGVVVALVEPGQVRVLRRLHDAAGVTAASHEVAAGHHVVRQIATSGTPVPPAPEAQAVPAAKAAVRDPARRRGRSQRERKGGSGGRAARVPAGSQEDTARGTALGTARGTGRSTARGTARSTVRGTAKPGRRSQNAHRPHQARGSRYAKKPA